MQAISIRVSEEEKREIRILAAEQNMNISDFIKMLIRVWKEYRDQ